jgi:hypothetical protein
VLFVYKRGRRGEAPESVIQRGLFAEKCVQTYTRYRNKTLYRGSRLYLCIFSVITYSLGTVFHLQSVVGETRKSNLVSSRDSMCLWHLLGVSTPDSLGPYAVLEQPLLCHIDLPVLQLPPLVHFVEAAARHALVDAVSVLQVVHVRALGCFAGAPAAAVLTVSMGARAFGVDTYRQMLQCK